MIKRLLLAKERTMAVVIEFDKIDNSYRNHNQATRDTQTTNQRFITTI
jgi:hypothetical protein